MLLREAPVLAQVHALIQVHDLTQLHDLTQVRARGLILSLIVIHMVARQVAQSLAGIQQSIAIHTVVLRERAFVVETQLSIVTRTAA